MKTNKLPESAWSDSQAAGSQIQQPDQSINDNEYGDSTQQKNHAINDASYDNEASYYHDNLNDEHSHYLTEPTSSQDDYFGYKSADKSLIVEESVMSSSEANKHLGNSSSHGKKDKNSYEKSGDDKNSHEQLSDVASGYKRAETLTENDPMMSELLDEQASNLYTGDLDTIASDNSFASNVSSNNDSASNHSANNHSHVQPNGTSSINNNSSYKQIPERVFMNGLIKHTGIALAIIIPLAAFSAYAATPPANVTANDMFDDGMSEKVTTDILSVEPSDIIYKSVNTPTTVDNVDLNAYAGTWYEIGRLPMYFQRKCVGDVTANYAQKTDGTGITVTNKCLAEDGSDIVAEGLAKPADESGSKLKVTFLPKWIRWIPVGRADYWVLARDADYKTALVGTPDKKYLWLLARSPNVSQETYTKYRQIAQQQGYDLKEFTLTSQTNQTVNLSP